jgi:hypothetical protein
MVVSNFINDALDFLFPYATASKNWFTDTFVVVWFIIIVIKVCIFWYVTNNCNIMAWLIQWQYAWLTNLLIKRGHYQNEVHVLLYVNK